MDRKEAGRLGYEKTRKQLQAHYQKQSRDARENYEANPKHCPTCGELIPYEKRYNNFCNQSCAASHNNLGVTRHIKGSKTCPCGKPKKPHNKYCSECNDNRVYNKITRLEDAKDDKVRKRILLQERGHSCEVCGLSDWMGEPIPIEIDHIDGNADNNSAENLRLICPNCHAQTETYKGANAGKESSRQIKRRKRYANGQTY